MDKQKQINDLKQNILDAKHNIEQAESKIKKLEKEDSFEFPLRFYNLNRWLFYLADVRQGLYSGMHLEQLLSNKKIYAEFKLKYITDQLSEGWKVDYDNYSQKAYYIYYAKNENSNYGKWDVAGTCEKDAVNVYFETRELGEKAIKLMASDIDYLRGE